MKNYIKLGKKILKNGHTEHTRIGKTIALHNETLSFDLKKGFPLMTTKFVGKNSIIAETLWYLKGTDSINFLKENNVKVWDMFANDKGSVGKTYSWQFRNFGGIDQVKEVIKQLNEPNITNRRAIINLYNVFDLPEMSIPPCIALIQFNITYIDNTKVLDVSVYQRSGDFCLGVPYDIAEMALLSHIIGAYTDSVPNNMTIFYSNIHIYEPHIEELKKQLKVKPKKLPTVTLNTENIKSSEPENLKKEYFNIINIPKNRKKFYYKLF